MKKLKVIIEKSADYYDAYCENCSGVYGAGNSPSEAKANLEEGLELYITSTEKEKLPVVLRGSFYISYKYDAQSFLNYYDKVFSKTALEVLTGINQKQLHHYASGFKKPREAQLKKIESALHNLGKELLSIEL